MTTHPETEVGSDTDAPMTEADSIAALTAAFAGEQAPDEEPEEEIETDETDEVEEVESDELEDVEADDLPPIDAPNSLKAEEKEVFATLPREAQEFVSRRIGDLERGFQTKAQEAAQTRQQFEGQYLEAVQQMQAQTADQLEQYARQLAVQEPDPGLVATDPQLYAQQMRAYRHYTAQREEAQRSAETARQEAQRAEQALEQREIEQMRSIIQDRFPEYLDAEQGPKLQQELSTVASELGYPPELISQARAPDILAMRVANDWRQKAIKYDALQKTKMEKVRAAKGKPKMTQPGTGKRPDGFGQAAGRLAQTGSVDDAAAAFKHLLK